VRFEYNRRSQRRKTLRVRWGFDFWYFATALQGRLSLYGLIVSCMLLPPLLAQKRERLLGLALQLNLYTFLDGRFLDI
jgi:hypothetical protein